MSDAFSLTPEEIEDMRAQSAVLHAIAAERGKQDAKWGEQNHPDGTGPRTRPLRYLGIEASADTLAEHSRHYDLPSMTWQDVLLEEVLEAFAEDDEDALREELVQCAAVCAAWIQAIDRRRAR